MTGGSWPWTAAALLVTAAALVAALAVLVRARDWRVALRVLLDLLLAAGLLRLAAHPSNWQALAGAAAVVLLRQVLWRTLAVRGRRPGGGSEPAAGSTPGNEATGVRVRGPARP